MRDWQVPALEQADLENRPATFAASARHFFDTFPQLEGVRFTHARGGVIELTRREIARADRTDGRRGLWLRTLDRFGPGFDS